MPDQDYRLMPLSFEKGINEQMEASMLPNGALPRLRNWEPSPSGELKTRIPWLKGSTTSAPSTRKARGIGYFSRTVTPSIVQYSVTTGNANAGGTVSLNCSWPTATTKGNTLVILYACVLYSGGTYLTTPSGWTAIAEDASGTSGDPSAVDGAYLLNAPSESGVRVVAGSSQNNAEVTVYLIEIAGLATSSALDQTATSSGSVTSTLTNGTTSATTQASEFILALFAQSDGSNGAATFSAPTNSHVILDQETKSGTYGLNTVVTYKPVTSTGTQTCGVTSTLYADYSALICTFKGWYTGTPSGSSVTKLLAAQNDTTEYDFFAIDRDSISNGTWVNEGSVSVSDPTKLVAMAPGLGRTWITNTQFASSYVYDGETISALTDTPAGTCIAVHKNRVWVAGTDKNPGRLWYSNINDGTTYDTLNYIDVQRDSGEVIEDIAPLQDQLVIATRTGLWMLTGSGPDSFVLNRLPVGGAAPGRTIMPTPYGGIVAGREYVWLITGDNSVSLASRPIANSYGMTGSFMTTSYINDQVYICDSASGVIWVLNLQTGTWREERIATAIEAPVCVYNHDDMQFFGPSAATTGSLLNYRYLPGTSKAKDFDTLTEVFSAWTGELWPVGPEYAITPRHLFLKLRQHGGNSTHTGLTVTPYYNGTAGKAYTITPRDSAAVFRERLDLGEKRGINYVQFRFDQTLGTTEDSCFDIEEATLGFNLEAVR